MLKRFIRWISIIMAPIGIAVSIYGLILGYQIGLYPMIIVICSISIYLSFEEIVLKGGEKKELLEALEEIFAIEKEIEDYRFQRIAVYPDGPIPQEIKDEWNRNLDEFSRRKLKACKKAKAILFKMTRKKY